MWIKNIIRSILQSMLASKQISLGPFKEMFWVLNQVISQNRDVVSYCYSFINHVFKIAWPICHSIGYQHNNCASNLSCITLECSILASKCDKTKKSELPYRLLTTP